jgi:glycosyltransferase involved in cell wall biosynthesis
MRILILGSKEYPLGSGGDFDPITSGGIEQYIENLSKEFIKHPEAQLLIITRKFPGTPSFQAINNIKIYRVNWLKGFFLRNPTFNLNAFLLGLRLKFDLVFSAGVVASFFGVILSFIRKVPLIHKFAGVHHLEPQYNFFMKKILQALEILAYRFRGDMIFLSEENKRNFESIMGFMPPKTHVVPTGIDVNHFCTPAIRQPTPPLRLITVGRLIEVKGIQDLLKSLKELKRDIDFVCSIVGEGPYRSSLEKMVEEYALREKVTFKGNVSQEKVVHLLQKAHIYILPSYAEALPLSLLEALACGLPCVVTDIGLPIKHEETGLIIPPSDPVAIAQAIIRLSADPVLMTRLGRNAREYAVSNHSSEKWARKISQICESLFLNRDP